MQGNDTPGSPVLLLHFQRGNFAATKTQGDGTPLTLCAYALG